MITVEQKTQVLLETLPWLHKYAGERVVIKYGGNAMVNSELQAAFAEDVRALYQLGVRPIVVHGGGPQINEMLTQLNLEAPFRDGLRVTTPEVMKVVRMVLTGSVQRDLVALLNRKSITAVGMSGEDGGLFKAVKTTVVRGGRRIDIGRVGEVTHVDPTPVTELLAAGRIPVVSSVALDADNPGEVLNINADSAAGELAVALNARKLIMLTDVEGLYSDYPKRDSLIKVISTNQLEKLLPNLNSGMHPKMSACLQAVRGGVGRATVLDGRVAHALLTEIFTDDGSGTMVVPEDEVTDDE
ncbi:MAG: acetylglutamate kinase [Varibaculum sp.]|nr:acetylglutamate kinase [Varibaculum sp.]